MKTIKKLLITVAVLLCSVTANAYDFEVDGIYYNILSASDLTVEVTSGDNKYIGEVIIPSTVTYKSRTLSVISIGNRAFEYCYDLTSVTIPNSVTTIGEYAFYDCTSLRDLRIEDGSNILSCNDKAFWNCPLKTLYLGRDLQNPYFSNNATLTSVTIGNSVTTIGENAFYSCLGLTSVTIGNSVTTIGDYAFSECRGLTSVTIGNSVTTIGYQAFYYCRSLTSVTIPNSVTTIGYQAFYECSGLTSVTIGNSVTTIGKEAFFGCSGLTSITIPNSVTTIGENAFYDCSGLTSVTIGNSVTTIEYQAFKNCTNLTSVTIGNSVTTIGGYAFNRCTGLTSVTIPNSVTTIEYQAFSDCTGLTSITIPNSVTTIKGGAFKNCTGLTSINLLGETPPSVGNNNFTEKQYVNITLYVPTGSLETYQNADTWENFWDIREMGTTETPEVEVKKCATPVITYNNSGLDITSETDDAEIHTNITCNDLGSYNGSRIDLSETYSITTYATKSGYQNSETVTATLCWIAVSGGSEENCIIEVEAMPVLITCDNGTIIICGGEDGAEVVVYTTSGVAVGNDIITNGNATVSTGLTKGETAIINIAGKGIKVVMQ